MSDAAKIAAMQKVNRYYQNYQELSETNKIEPADFEWLYENRHWTSLYLNDPDRDAKALEYLRACVAEYKAKIPGDPIIADMERAIRLGEKWIAGDGVPVDKKV
jgi:hypothetical protein